MSKRKNISITTPSGTYKSYDEAYKEARALRAYLDDYLKNNTNYYIQIGVSDINPRRAEYRFIPCGVGRPKKDLIFKADKNPYVNPHLHILIVNSEHADTIANKIIDYLSARHSSIRDDDYKLQLHKDYVSDRELQRTIHYIDAQSRNSFSCKPKRKETSKEDNNFNVINNGIETACINQEKSEPITTLSKEQNELLLNLRFSYLLGKFLFRLSKIFNDLYAHELIYIKNQLCTAAEYVKRNMLTYAYNICDTTTADLTLLREKLRQLLRYSSIDNKKSIELESENIYKMILEKLEKSEFS
ncbi:MAG: hypothetical protein IKK91_03225 [Ruminococcus sp.]|nr:hypothetical protein [Ruminococcus sp.]